MASTYLVKDTSVSSDDTGGQVTVINHGQSVKTDVQAPVTRTSTKGSSVGTKITTTDPATNVQIRTEVANAETTVQTQAPHVVAKSQTQPAHTVEQQAFQPFSLKFSFKLIPKNVEPINVAPEGEVFGDGLVCP